MCWDRIREFYVKHNSGHIREFYVKHNSGHIRRSHENCNC